MSRSAATIRPGLFLPEIAVQDTQWLPAFLICATSRPLTSITASSLPDDLTIHSSCKTDDCQFVLARSFPGLVQSAQGFQQPLFVRQAVKIPGIEVKQEDAFSLKRFQFHGWASRSINSSGSEFGRLYSDPRIVV